MTSAPRCPTCTAPMRARGHFRLGDEPTDTPNITAQLRDLEAAGLKLGADGTVWYCGPCDTLQVDFEQTP